VESDVFQIAAGAVFLATWAMLRSAIVDAWRHGL